MKLLIELYKETIDIKAEIDMLTAEINLEGITLDAKLSLLAEITALHQQLNHLRKKIRERAPMLAHHSVYLA